MVKAGLSTEVRFCAILAVFLLCCYHQEPPIRKAAKPGFVECARLGVGCWVGILVETSMPTKPKTELADAILRTTDITAFFCFLFVLVEVPHARMRKVSGFRLCFE